VQLRLTPDVTKFNLVTRGETETSFFLVTKLNLVTSPVGRSCTSSARSPRATDIAGDQTEGGTKYNFA